MVTDSEVKTLFSSPQGPACDGPYSDGSWCLDILGTVRETTCEGCNTVWPAVPEGSDSYSLSTIMGYTIVDKCCGRAIDDLLERAGENFAVKMLEFFIDDPLGYRLLRRFLAKSILTLQKAIEENEE